jgi:hypothetical protein
MNVAEARLVLYKCASVKRFLEDKCCEHGCTASATAHAHAHTMQRAKSKEHTNKIHLMRVERATDLTLEGCAEVALIVFVELFQVCYFDHMKAVLLG